MRKIALHWQILIAFIIAVLFGIFLKDQVKYVSWMGEVFLRMLKMIVIPLILSSIVSGIANIGGEGNFGRLGLKTIGYYMLTSILAITVGLVLVNLIKPGVGMDISSISFGEVMNFKRQSMEEMLVSIVPKIYFSPWQITNFYPLFSFQS